MHEKNVLMLILVAMYRVMDGESYPGGSKVCDNRRFENDKDTPIWKEGSVARGSQIKQTIEGRHHQCDSVWGPTPAL